MVSKTGRFYQPKQALDISEYYHLFLLVDRSVKMCRKGVEKRKVSGFRNAPQYSSKDDRNDKFKNIVRDASCVVSDASDSVWDWPYRVCPLSRCR